MEKKTDGSEEKTGNERPKPPETKTTNQPATDTPTEVGGRDGPDPTRFGDWEKNGRCIDF